MDPNNPLDASGNNPGVGFGSVDWGDISNTAAGVVNTGIAVLGSNAINAGVQAEDGYFQTGLYPWEWGYAGPARPVYQQQTGILGGTSLSTILLIVAAIFFLPKLVK